MVKISRSSNDSEWHEEVKTYMTTSSSSTVMAVFCPEKTILLVSFRRSRYMMYIYIYMMKIFATSPHDSPWWCFGPVLVNS